MTINWANTELLAFNSAISKFFLRIHGKPSRQDRDTLHREKEHVLVDDSVPCFEWSGNYRLLAEVRIYTNYTNLSGLSYTDIDGESKMNDSFITDTMSDFEKDKNKTELNGTRTSWYTQQGVLCAIYKNIQGALDKAYYKQSEGNLMGYQ